MILSIFPHALLLIGSFVAHSNMDSCILDTHVGLAAACPPLAYEATIRVASPGLDRESSRCATRNY
jgi:hypothetical protein